jgi:hypothetical protein
MCWCWFSAQGNKLINHRVFCSHHWRYNCCHRDCLLCNAPICLAKRTLFWSRPFILVDRLTCCVGFTCACYGAGRFKTTSVLFIRALIHNVFFIALKARKERWLYPLRWHGFLVYLLALNIIMLNVSGWSMGIILVFYTYDTELILFVLYKTSFVGNIKMFTLISRCGWALFFGVLLVWWNRLRGSSSARSVGGRRLFALLWLVVSCFQIKVAFTIRCYMRAMRCSLVERI